MRIQRTELCSGALKINLGLRLRWYDNRIMYFRPFKAHMVYNTILLPDIRPTAKTIIYGSPFMA